MAEATAVSSFSSPKARLLKFLSEQSRPASAKEAAVFLDTRTSSASELLERCAAQGLCARGENDRPRLYSLTEQGSERLRWLGVQPARPSSEAENDSHAGEEGITEENDAGVDRAASGEILSEVRALREDVRDLSEMFAAGRSSAPAPQSARRGDARPEEAEGLIRRADTLSREAAEKTPEKLRALLLRDVDVLRQAVAATQESGALAVILPKVKKRMLHGARRSRKEAAFGADAVAARLREVSESLGGSEKLPAQSAADLAADPEAARSRLLTRSRNAQKLFERARQAEAFDEIPELADSTEKLSEFFAGLTQRLETAAAPESKQPARKGGRANE